MFCAIDTVAVPITIGCILAGMVLVGGIALYDQRRKSLRRAMPAGAEAALWSITEVLPDPRNHLAIKDPTSELRLTDDERREAAEAAAQARLRASTSNDRPARRAALSRSASAHEAAAAKREAQALARQRKIEERERLEREIAAREADDRERAPAKRVAASGIMTKTDPSEPSEPIERPVVVTIASGDEPRAAASTTDTLELPRVVVTEAPVTAPVAQPVAEPAAAEARPAITFDSPEIAERLQALSAEALATDSLFANLGAAAGRPEPGPEPTDTAEPAPSIDLRGDTGGQHFHPRAS